MELKIESDEVNVNAELKENMPSEPWKNYRFEGVLGKGAFAKVWQAWYKDEKKPLAVKVIELESTNPSSMETTRKETALMLSLRHENVVPCLASFVVGSELWLVMPLLAGGSCADIMRRHPEFKNGFKDDALLATIMLDVLRGLAYFHKEARIHRDIKAGNILISAEGVAKLSDFGVSGALIENGYKRMGRKTFTGTPCWMAPEVMESKGHNHKADIWSLGITALEMGFGKPPYANQRPMKIILNITEKAPPTADSYNKEERDQGDLSKDFHKFVKACLKRDPTKRPRAKDLMKDHFIKKAKPNRYVQNRVLFSLPEIKLKSEELPKSLQGKGPVETSERTMMSTASWNFSNIPKTCSKDNLNLDSIPEAKSSHELPQGSREQKASAVGIENEVVGTGACASEKLLSLD